MRRSMYVIVVSSIALALAHAAAAQTQITTGVIQGVVTDTSGAVLPGVDVEARNVETNLARNVVTDRDGRFVALQLPPGRYKVTFKLTGFATFVQENILLSVGQAAQVSPVMKVSGVAETVTVSADSPTVETARTASASTLNQTTVETTPILGRKFEDLLTLTPGVSVVQGPDGDEITFAGQRGVFNNISLDGGDYNNGFFGEQMGGQRAAIDITLEAVKEFQVVATGANAEFGRTGGGIVNVITKSGHQYRERKPVRVPAAGGPHRERVRRPAAHRLQPRAVRRHDRRPDQEATGCSTSWRFEGIRETLQRANLSTPIGSTPCPVSAPTVPANEALINTNADCQRVALLNFFRTNRAAGGRESDRSQDQQQRRPREVRLEPRQEHQPLRVVQLQLLEEHQPDVRRRNLRRFRERDRGAVEDQRPEHQRLLDARRQQGERVPRHLLAGEPAAVGDRFQRAGRHRHGRSTPTSRPSGSAIRSSWRRTSTSW